MKEPVAGPEGGENGGGRSGCSLLAPTAQGKAGCDDEAEQACGGFGDGGEGKVVDRQTVVISSVVIFNPADPEIISGIPSQCSQGAPEAGNLTRYVSINGCS